MITWGDWILTPARAAIHRGIGTAVVADLHLGYGEARRRGGDAVPVAPVEETLAPLAAVLAEFDVRSLVIAGDLFESGPEAAIVERLDTWLKRRNFNNVTVVPGNHDRGLKKVPHRLRPATVPVMVGGWQIVHGDGRLPDGAFVQGHLHPAIRPAPGFPLLPCYLLTAGHLILPAYTLEAAGVDMSRQARWHGYRCVAIAGGECLPLTIPLAAR
jgi:metallophosphoesterase superfamily enzyme